MVEDSIASEIAELSQRVYGFFFDIFIFRFSDVRKLSLVGNFISMHGVFSATVLA